MIRACANRKSAKHPDVQCPLKATHGEFCFRHFKNPKRFVKLVAKEEEVVDQPARGTSAQLAAKERLVRAWRFWGGLVRARRHGPALGCREVSQNSTEVTTMDDVSQIPAMYLFSHADKEGKIWTFDIRSLIGIASHSKEIENPYTRETFTKEALVRFHALVDWLRARKFATQFLEDEAMNEEQVWNQKVLDVFLKLDKLGFTTNLDWFHQLRRPQLAKFYAEIFYLWKYLPLKKEQKAAIIPEGTFKEVPERIIGKNHDLRWWQEEALRLIDIFIGYGTEASSKSSGAIYVVRCLCCVSSNYAEAYSWLIT